MKKKVKSEIKISVNFPTTVELKFNFYKNSFTTFRSPISPLLKSKPTEKANSIKHDNILTTSHEYSNGSLSSRDQLKSPFSSTSGWNGFSQNFPSFVETLNIYQRNTFSSPETFESLMSSLTLNNLDESLKKLDENTIMPKDETVYKVLVEKVVARPELIDAIVEVFKAVLRNKNFFVSNSNFNNTNSTVIKIIIVNKLEVLLGKEAANTQLFTIIKLIQKLYHSTIISKHCVNHFIDLIKLNESGNQTVEHYATMLEKNLKPEKFKRNVDNTFSDPSNNEMTSSGEWSDFDSETARHGVMR